MMDCGHTVTDLVIWSFPKRYSYSHRSLSGYGSLHTSTNLAVLLLNATWRSNCEETANRLEHREVNARPEVWNGPNLLQKSWNRRHKHARYCYFLYKSRHLSSHGHSAVSFAKSRQSSLLKIFASTPLWSFTDLSGIETSSEVFHCNHISSVRSLF